MGNCYSGALAFSVTERLTWLCCGVEKQGLLQGCLTNAEVCFPDLSLF